jgi:hypothetical protein
MSNHPHSLVVGTSCTLNFLKADHPNLATSNRLEMINFPPSVLKIAKNSVGSSLNVNNILDLNAAFFGSNASIPPSTWAFDSPELHEDSKVSFTTKTLAVSRAPKLMQALKFDHSTIEVTTPTSTSSLIGEQPYINSQELSIDNLH